METEQKNSSNTVVSNDNWYANLKKSSLTPPNWVFGPAWAFLYALIILSFVIYIQSEYSYAGIVLYVLQFAVNLSWTPLFFIQHRVCHAALHLFVLNILVFLTYRVFRSASKIAAYLLGPYMAWILFALYLNLYICAYNT